MWVHPKLHGYTFIYPHRVKSERELDESARNITGIFLYTHSSEFRLISIISRVYFYVPAITGLRDRREFRDLRDRREVAINRKVVRAITLVSLVPIVPLVSKVPLVANRCGCTLSFTGILLYTRNYRGVPPTISRVYFYIPAITGIVPYSIAGILL